MKKTLFALTALGMTTGLSAAAYKQADCQPEPPTACRVDECACMHCLGPDMVNPPVRPKTCEGDLLISLSGLYWTAQQDGMEYAVETAVSVEHATNGHIIVPGLLGIGDLNYLINAQYHTPNFKWDFGFKLGIGYNTTHDGWDIGAYWTWFRGRSVDHIEAELTDNYSLIPLWSAFSSVYGYTLFATDIEANWKMNLNLVDIELGREFWTSKFLSLRPHIGLRIAFIDQSYDLKYKGGAWAETNPLQTILASQTALNGYTDLDNDFKGAGIRAGLDSTWNLGCGWAFYGNLALAIIYGRFNVDHDEWNREALAPHAKIKVLETDESFRASRAILDLALGLQWATFFCDGTYAFTAMLGWEQHIFFHQNQMWRVNRIGDAGVSSAEASSLNNTGENVFLQSRGDLDTKGWTLTFKFEF